jgi:hypothetical protein
MSTVPTPRSEATRVASTLNVLAGIWLIISPFALGFTPLPAALWNTLIVGIVVVVFAGIRAGNPALYPALSWLNLLLGVWLIISPFLLRYAADHTPLGNNVILGIIVGVLGIWSALATPTTRLRT